jgi:hypothetical protein
MPSLAIQVDYKAILVDYKAIFGHPWGLQGHLWSSVEITRPSLVSVFRLLTATGSGQFPQGTISGCGRNRSDPFRRNPGRNPFVRNPTKSGSIPIGFTWESCEFRCDPASDPMVSGRIRRSE